MRARLPTVSATAGGGTPLFARHALACICLGGRVGPEAPLAASGTLAAVNRHVSCLSQDRAARRPCASRPFIPLT
jgi:hypothetical protein